jgi:acyl-CoA synthetase (AMP-forming)/AMP-acid ligase II
MISHHNVIAQIMQVRQCTVPDCPNTMLAVLPFYHSESLRGRFEGWTLTLRLVTGIVQILAVPLVLNQEVVVMSKFKFEEMLEVIEQYKCDELWMVPRK